jgi:aminopeptidase N
VANNKVITHWQNRYPIASYLICFAVSNYNVLTGSVAIDKVNVPMLTYCYPENQGVFQAGAANATDAMVQFSKLVGDYPFKTRNMVMCNLAGEAAWSIKLALSWSIWEKRSLRMNWHISGLVIK